jgi:hypothetical protein
MSCPLKNSNRRNMQRSAYDIRMNEFYNNKNSNNYFNNNNNTSSFVAPPYPTSRTDFDMNLQQTWCPSCPGLAPTPIPFDNPYKFPNPTWCQYTNTCANSNPSGSSGPSGPPSTEMYGNRSGIRNIYERNGNRMMQPKRFK